MKFDDLLGIVGEYGPYQRWIFILTCLTNVHSGIFMLIPVFLLGQPKHRCALTGYDSDTYEIQNAQHRILVNSTIPPSSDSHSLYDQCHVLTGNMSHDLEGERTNGSVISCSRYVYDKSVFEATFLSENDLVCDKSIYSSNAQMLFYAGMLVGSVVSGIVADRFGRKVTMNVSLCISLVSAIAIAFSQSYAVFAFLFFILGASIVGVFMPAYIIGLEMVGPSKRVLAGVAGDFYYVIGYLLVGGVGYALRHWKHIELAVAVPCCLFLTYWWLVPESPRWLLSQGRVKEAEVVVRRIARSNKTYLPDDILKDVAIDSDKDKGKFWQLFTSKTMCIRTLIMFFAWFTVSVAYYGLSLNIENLNNDFYLDYTLYGLVELPAYILTFVLLDRVGRKLLYSVPITVAGLACIATIFTSTREESGMRVLTTCLGMTGKFGVTVGFAVVYVYGVEVFPTVVRNAGMGGCSLSARVGGMLAPYLVQLGALIGGSFGHAFPLMLIGAVSVVSGLLSFLLPETLNRQLPETIQDAEMLAVKQKMDRKTMEESVIVPNDDSGSCFLDTTSCKLALFEDSKLSLQPVQS